MVTFNNDKRPKSWPEGFAQIVCNNPKDFNKDACRGHCVDATCADCGTELNVDSFTLDFVSLVAPHLKPKTICLKCLTEYSPIGAGGVVDLRRKNGQQ